METRPKVTVIVPVHNPGPALERSIASVLAQTMPPGDLEAIFVDDGSTDGSGARLDEVAAASPHVRVLHIPASGSPGRPRNLALAEARGDYVQFLDADDRLAPGAAERGHATAVRNGADIVVAKLVSDFRSVSWDLFRTSREACSVLDAPLIANLTVSKLFRTAFLREHDIRFPEGWSKIEDERFVVRAYLAARVVSVDADEPAYFYCGRADGGNLSSAPVDPGTYCEHLREILGLVTAGVEAGEPRTRLLRRFYRTDMLGRLGDEAYLAGEDAYRSAVFASVRALALETMDDEVHAGLGALLRLRSTLLREGRPEALLDLARRSLDLRLDVVAGPVETTGGGLQVPVRAGVHWADGTPLALVRDGDRLLLDPRLVDGVTPEPFDVAGDVDRLRLIAAMRDRDTAVEWVVPPGGRVTLRPVGSGTVSPVLHGSLALDPDGVGPGRRSLDPGAWEVIVRVRGLDHDLRTPLLAGRRPPVALPARLLRRPPGLARAEVVPGEPVVIRVEAGHGALALRQGGARLMRDGRRIEVLLPLAAGREALASTFLVAGAGEGIAGPAARAHRGGVLVTLDGTSVAPLGRGVQPLSLAVAGERARIGTVTVAGTAGQAVARVEGVVRAGAAERLATRVLAGRRAATHLVLGAGRVVRRRLRG